MRSFRASIEGPASTKFFKPSSGRPALPQASASNVNMKGTPTSAPDERQIEIGHPTSESTIYNLLARHQWRKLMPRPFHPERDEKAQEAYKKRGFARP